MYYRIYRVGYFANKVWWWISILFGLIYNTVSPFLINPHYIQQQSSEQDASNDNTTGEDGVSSTAGGAINLSSRPSSVPESQATTQASVNPSTTPTLVEPDSQEDQVSFWCYTIFPTHFLDAKVHFSYTSDLSQSHISYLCLGFSHPDFLCSEKSWLRFSDFLQVVFHYYKVAFQKLRNCRK